MREEADGHRMHGRDNPELERKKMQGTTAQFPPLTDNNAPKVESIQPPANKGPPKQAMEVMGQEATKLPTPVLADRISNSPQTALVSIHEPALDLVMDKERQRLHCRVRKSTSRYGSPLVCAIQLATCFDARAERGIKA